MKKEIVRLLACPECGGKLSIKEESSNREINEGELYCLRCSSSFPIREGIPILIPRRIRDALNLPDQQLEGFSHKERTIIKQIRAWEEITPTYFDVIVDPLRSVKSAQVCERYEDLFVTQLLNEKVERNKVAFIEIGSGPGRYFILLGSRISRNPEASKLFKGDPIVGKYYQFNEELFRNLKLIVGLDFIENMVKDSINFMNATGLQDLIYTRIVPLVGIAQMFDLNLEEYKDTHKVISCVFQTLGNQLLRGLQIDILKVMKKLATPNGTILITAFNSEKFEEYGLKELYREVSPVIGAISTIDKKYSSLESERGFYTRWCTEEELNSLLKEAGLTPKIKRGNALPIFDKDFEYISFKEQKKAQEMMIITTAEV